jgi:acyl carrier protein/nucleoside-diphosphate-sugar epimerase
LLQEDSPYAPLLIDEFRFYQQPTQEQFQGQLWCHARLESPPAIPHIPEQTDPTINTTDDATSDPTSDTSGAITGRVRAHIRLFDSQGRIFAEIKGIEARRAPQQVLLRLLQPKLSHWFYQVEWQLKPLVLQSQAESLTESLTKSRVESGKDTERWLIFTHREGIGLHLADRLRTLNQVCIVVFPGNTYRTLGTTQADITPYELNPTQPQDFQQLWAELFSQPITIQAILYSWSVGRSVDGSVGRQPPEPLSLSHLTQDQELGCGGVLHLVQTLLPTYPQPDRLPHLWLLTQTSQATEPTLPLQPEQSALWGLARVIGTEYSELPCACLDLDRFDLDGTGSERSPERLLEISQAILQEVLRPDGEDQIAHRRGQRYVARLRRLSLQPLGEQVPNTENGAIVHADGCYLITGGLGALGLQVAAWLVKQGAGHLVLTGRREPTIAAQATIQNLQEQGATIQVLPVDVSEEETVNQMVAHLATAYPPLRGVIHAAGILQDGLLPQLTWQDFATVLAPKLQGAWNLHWATQQLNLNLDFFVCFSSTASLLGSPGQGNYAAANGALDGLCHYRHSLGLPALSINWGAWADQGMAARAPHQWQRSVKDWGMDFITPEQGLQALELLLSNSLGQRNTVGQSNTVGQNQAQVMVLPINWNQFFRQLPPRANLPLLEDLAGHLAGRSSPAKPSKLLQQLQTTKPEERRAVLLTYLQIQIAATLHFSDPNQIEPRQSLLELGIDSLIAIELKNRLELDLGHSIRSTVLFDYPTLEALVDYLATDLLGIKPSLAPDSGTDDYTAHGPADSAPQSSLESEIQALSEADAEALLLQELNKINY